MWKSARTRDLAGDADRSLGLILIAVVVFEINQMRWRSNKDTSVEARDGNRPRQLVGKDLPSVKNTIAIGINQDSNAS